LNRFSCITVLGFLICAEKIAFTRELVNHFYKKLQDRRHKIQDKRDKERFDRLSDRRFYGQAARSGIAPYGLSDRRSKKIFQLEPFTLPLAPCPFFLKVAVVMEI